MTSDWKLRTKNKKLTFFKEDEEKHSSEPFFFIQGADIQLGLTEFYENKLKGLPPPSGRYWKDEMILAEKAVERINKLQPPPRFFVICGDLCNAFPVAQKDMRAQQEEDFKAIFSKIHPSIPLVCVCGNHDVGDQPTEECVEMYRSSFGDDFYSFWCGGVLFLVLNSQYYYDSSKIPELYAEQESWLDSVLAEGKKVGARILVFQHIPWYINSIDESNEYFNLPHDSRKPLLEKLMSAGVTHIFSGHLHYNSYTTYKSLEMVTTTAIGYQLGKDAHGMRIVKVNKTGVEHLYLPLNNFPETVDI